MSSPEIPPAEKPTKLFGLTWPRETTPAQRKALVAAGLGWMLDGMDVMLYSFVLAHLTEHFGMSKGTAGFLNSLTLVASAIGGVLFGFIADRVGRTRALMASILVYSLASGACGFTQTVAQLGLFRFVLGLGMGGEWATGAALVAETWPSAHRGKALALMQSTWAIGEAIAYFASGVLLSFGLGWRSVFFFGVLPALIVFWIRRGVEEPAIWKEKGAGEKTSLRLLWENHRIRRYGLLATAMNTCGMFGYWGLFTWIPAYLMLPVEAGGRGLGIMKTTAWLLIMLVGKWFGYTLFGFIADAVGRKKTYIAYLLVAAGLVPFYGMTSSPTWLLILGPFVAFFGTGFFSGFSAISSELFPTSVRATAMGLSYNLGRGISAVAPAAIGLLATKFGLGSAFFLTAAAFFAGAMLAFGLPETKGVELQ